MQLLAPRLQQACVGRVLNERVFEYIGRVGERATAENKLRLGELVEGITQIVFLSAGDSTQ